ncbi:gamma-glutamyltransferase [soil metagenome]
MIRVLIAALLFPPVVFADTPARKAVESKQGMVVCVCPLAAQVGVDILKAGGNAVDAAVAVGFAQSVTWPEAGNIGGGGFMMVWPGTGQDATCFDYREMAPALATKDLFADGKTDWTSPKSSGVPGTVRGLALGHSRFGKLPWKQVVAPSLKLAEGFTVDGPLARALNHILEDAKTTNAEFRRVYGKGKEKWAVGDTLKLPDLGKTLAGIAEQGPDYFYTGPQADQLEKEMVAGGGLIRKTDLSKYAAKERKVITGTYRGYEIIGAPPVSSGGTTLILALNMLEQFKLDSPRQSPQTIHLLAEVQRRAYVDRARHLGDPEFTSIPAHLYDKAYAKKLAAGIDLNHATKSETLAPELDIKEGTSTTHFSIIDKDGMAVSNTYTLENSFGNRIVVLGAGYILNNEMTDFNPIPGVTTRTGKVGTEANQIVPGKRMLSSMCPIFIAKDGKLIGITGSPGGRTIINTVMCITVNLIDYHMDAQAAVDEPRSHHQWFPDRLQIEKGKERPGLTEKLKELGHTVITNRQGDGHTIWIDPVTGVRYGAADSRLNGQANGY